eukprot:6102013-Ditylum_brightwellii.AAC.1
MPHYLVKETAKGRKDFSMGNVYEEEAEELNCESEINGKEIDDLYNMAHIEKEVKTILKDKKDADSDDP